MELTRFVDIDPSTGAVDVPPASRLTRHVYLSLSPETEAVSVRTSQRANLGGMLSVTTPRYQKRDAPSFACRIRRGSSS